MSGLGAIVLGAAFWPPAAVECRLAVRLTFAEELSESDRKAKLAEVEAALRSESERAIWAAAADQEAPPRAFVFVKLASFLPAAVRAESTLAASPIENEGKLTGVDVTFSDSDSLRAERFAQAIATSFEGAASECDTMSPRTPIVSDPAKKAERDEALASIRRDQDRLQKALDNHFEELRSLRSEFSAEPGAAKKDASQKKSTARAVPSNAAPRSISVRKAMLENVLWQVSPDLSRAELERRIAALEADLAAKKAARVELLSKFTAHHPVASALGVAIERLERERRELERLLSPANDPAPAPPAQALAPQRVAPQPTSQQSPVAPPASRPAPAPAVPVATVPRSASSPAPTAPAPIRDAQPSTPVAPEATAPFASDVNQVEEAAKKAAAEEIAASKKAVVEALEKAIRSEEALKNELRSLGEASNALALDSTVASSAAQPAVSRPSVLDAPALDAAIVDLEESRSVENRFALLLAGSLLFACLMTALAWSVSRERAVGSAEEVRLASGLPVVGQSTAGLLDRKPRRNFPSIAVSSSLMIVEGAAFATAVFCVAALAAENPRCEQILRQPLAIAWQALQSLT